jgi:hypothetical protein
MSKKRIKAPKGAITKRMSQPRLKSWEQPTLDDYKSADDPKLWFPKTLGHVDDYTIGYDLEKMSVIDEPLGGVDFWEKKLGLEVGSMSESTAKYMDAAINSLREFGKDAVEIGIRMVKAYDSMVRKQLKAIEEIGKLQTLDVSDGFPEEPSPANNETYTFEDSESMMDFFSEE